MSVANHVNKSAFEGQWQAGDDNTVQHKHPVSDEFIPVLQLVPGAANQSCHKQIVKEVAAFCNEAERLTIDGHPTNRDALPRMFMHVDLDELKDGPSNEHTFITIEVVREDGQIARAALTLSYTALNGLRASLTCQKTNNDPKVSLPMTFVDWEKPS